MPRKITDRLLLVLCWISFACVGGTAGFSQGAGNKLPVVAAAQADISRGKLDSAEEKLWAVLSADPNQSEALTLLGNIRGKQKRYPEAEALFRRALQLDPKSFAARRSLAGVLVAQNKTDTAIDAYVDLVKVAPQDIQSRIQLANLYLTKGQFAEALADLDAIPPSRLPEEAIPAKAASLLGLGRAGEASALIPRAKSRVIAAGLAEVFLEGNSPKDALKLLDAILKSTHSPPAIVYALKGRALQAMGDRAGALKNFRDALARDPKSADTLVAMAAVYASQSQHAESLALLKRAYALQPDSPEILRPLVIEGMKAGERNTASRAAHVLATNNPDNLDDVYLAAAVMLEGKDFATASAMLRKYVLQRPDDSKGFLGLGIAELAQQHGEDARQALERAIQIDPTFADAEYQLAMVADQQGQMAEELKHLKRAIELQPNHAKALASLGGQYLQAGDLENAQAVLERSVSVDPNNSKSQYDLALVLAKRGKTEEAKPHMVRSRELKAAEDLGKSPSAGDKNP